MLTKHALKLQAYFLAFILLVMTVHMDCLVSNAETSMENTVNTFVIQQDDREYEAYVESGSIKSNAKEDIVIALQSFVTDSNNVVIGDTIKWNAEGGKIETNITIPDDALYNVSISYRHFGETSNNIELSFAIDGSFGFDDCESLSLNRFWKDETSEPQVDDNGNEYSPNQVATEEFREQYLRDETGIVGEPYLFAFSKGTHTLTFEVTTGIIEIEKIVLTAPCKVLSYSDVLKEYNDKGYEWFTGEEPVLIEGESAELKSHKMIISQSSNSSAQLTPNNPLKNVVNYIGGDNWASAGNSVIWKINVEKSGIYKFNFRYQQRGVINGVTYRDLKIDGAVPFEEAQSIPFQYTTGWSTKALEDEDGNAYGVYLEEGEHEIELVCTLGPVADLYKKLEDIVSKIGDRYIEIVMITGESPDANRDYELFKQIPDFNESMEEDREALLKLAEESEALSGSNGNQTAASFRNMARVLESMINNKYTAHNYLSDYYSSYNTISGWLSDMRSMPLSIDSIELCSEEYDCTKKVSSTMTSILFSVKRFFVSFVSNYNTSDAEKNYDLRLWVNWGRDQSQVLNSLIKNSFTPKTGLTVKLEIVSTSIINGILSGNAPDLVLQQSRSSPVNLAMRGALVDLSEFDDFEEVLGRFQEGAAEPYYYNGGCYAVPDTQSFMVMFYRKDVLDALEIEAPETWEEYTAAAVKILRNNMQISLPYTKMNGTAAADGGVGALSLYPTLLIQNGVSIYNDERNKCNLDSAGAISVFADWTELYTDYKILKEANFYNRFRLGTMPLGIAQYNLYTQIVTAAPEISGKWGIALVPGTEKSDGTIVHSVSGAGSGASILKISENKEAAWEFIKWWTDADTQFTYSENIECVLGPTGRVMTSNVEAFSQMSWSKEDKEILLEQWNNVVEIPEVPGSYYLARSIDQAYWEVMNGKNTPKESLIKWTKVANAEIERKIKEYS